MAALGIYQGDRKKIGALISQHRQTPCLLLTLGAHVLSLGSTLLPIKGPPQTSGCCAVLRDGHDPHWSLFLVALPGRHRSKPISPVQSPSFHRLLENWGCLSCLHTIVDWEISGGPNPGPPLPRVGDKVEAPLACPFSQGSLAHVLLLPCPHLWAIIVKPDLPGIDSTWDEYFQYYPDDNKNFLK